MATTLPSLNALRAFEAAARRRSMTRAAEELCVTHGAVSRQVKALEATLGVPLFTRGGTSLEPTPEGLRLAEGLSTAFGLMQSTIENIKPAPLTLSCSASIMMCWLIPRISNFYVRNPDMKIELNMNYNTVDFIRDNISVAIRNSVIPPPRNAIIRDLGREWVGLVCSPDYIRSTRIDSMADLSRAVLLTTNSRPEAWSDWLRACGGPPIEPASERHFDHFYLLTQAAACGLGVAVVPRMLALGELQSGRLVAPFGFVPGPRELMLWIAPQLGGRRDVRSLEKWLVSEMKEPASGIAAPVVAA